MTVLPHVVSGTRGGPVLVFVHPLGADLRFWDECRAALDPVATCVAMDLRGAGTAPLPPEPWPLDRQAADIEALRDHLGAERIVPVGCAIGAMAAATYAARFPGRTAALVLSNPGIETRPAARDMLARRAAAVRRGGMAAILPDAVDKAFAGQPEDGRKARHVERFAAQDPEGYALSILGILDADIGGLAARIACPTLLLPGGRDVLLPSDHADALAALIPRAELRLVPDAAHFFPYQRPDAFAALVSGFLARMPAGGGPAAFPPEESPP